MSLPTLRDLLASIEHQSLSQPLTIREQEELSNLSKRRRRLGRAPQRIPQKEYIELLAKPHSPPRQMAPASTTKIVQAARQRDVERRIAASFRATRQPKKDSLIRTAQRRLVKSAGDGQSDTVEKFLLGESRARETRIVKIAHEQSKRASSAPPAPVVPKGRMMLVAGGHPGTRHLQQLHCELSAAIKRRAKAARGRSPGAKGAIAYDESAVQDGGPQKQRSQSMPPQKSGGGVLSGFFNLLGGGGGS